MSSTMNGSAVDGTVAGYTLAEPRTPRPRMKRSRATSAGWTADVDPAVARELDVLEGLLGRRVVPPGDPVATLRTWVSLPLTPRRTARGGAGTTAAAAKRAASESKAAESKAAKAAGAPAYRDGSLGDRLADQQVGEDDLTLEEVVDRDPTLARARYEVDAHLDEVASELSLAERAVLERPGLRTLLLLRAVLLKSILSPEAVVAHVRGSDRGVREVVAAVVVGAARQHLHARGMSVPTADDDQGVFAAAVRAGVTSLTEDAFETQVDTVVDQLLDSAEYDAVVEAAGLDGFPDLLRPRLVELIKASRVTITVQNAAILVPPLAAQAMLSSSERTAGPGADPFAVEFFVEDAAQLQVSTAAVRCAAQLYYVMTLGDELGVFDAVRYFTHRHLFREGFAVEDRTLRRDLENYVFSEQFPGWDEEAGEVRMMRCTQDAERRSFYRQVFDETDEAVPGDGLANSDFRRLWKILMLESARHIEKAQSSPHADAWVSRQNVMQAVEDLQYNLSSSCVGMATVMTPLMHAELDFVVKRILGHPEVRRHLVPSGGSWWKVVERLQGAQGRRTRASVLNNKARTGYSLVRGVAEYTPSRFEQDAVFFPFLSDVEAFITTQSILQEEADGAGPDAHDGAHAGAHGGYGGYGQGFPGMPALPGLGDLPGMPAVPGLTGGSGAYAGGSGSTGVSGSAGGAGRLDGHGRATGGAGDEWDF